MRQPWHFTIISLPSPARVVIEEGNPGSCANRNRGWHGAVRAPVHGYQPRVRFYDPAQLHWAGSTLTWRRTPGRGQGPQRQAGRKHVSAWRHPPFSVCAVPTLRPEGSRAHMILYQITRGRKRIPGTEEFQRPGSVVPLLRCSTPPKNTA